LGYIIELVSGKTYTQYLEDNFFKPLAMHNTSYDVTAEIVKNRVAGYQEEEGYKNASFLSMTQPYAAGSLLSTVEDLSIWYHAVAEGKVIGKDLLVKAHHPFKLNNGKATNYGYGWFLGNIQGSPMFEHGGGINGFLTASIFLPKEQVFVSIFSNCNCHAPSETAIKLAAVAIEKPYEWKKITIKKKELASYVAIYKSNESGQRTIELKDGKLFSTLSGRRKNQIFPFAKDQFFFEGGTTTLHFQRDKNGDITEVISKSPSGSLHWKRSNEKIEKQKSIQLSTTVLEQYVGTYQLAPTFSIVIFRDKKKLYAQATGQGKVAIQPYEKNKFSLVGVDAKIIFNFDENKVVNSLTLVQNGEHFGKKVK